MSLNRAQLLGHVGSAPEVRCLTNGKVANFRIATSKRWRDRNTGEQKEVTEWHSITVWGDGIIEKVIEPYVSKGSKLFVEGELRTRKWQDSNGNDRYSTEVVVSGREGRLTLCGSSNGGGDSASPRRTAAALPPSNAEPYDDDIPF